MIISSQRYLDDAIVAEKLQSRDFRVVISPEFCVDEETYQIVMDGHHSLAAARIAGVDPCFDVQDSADNDTLILLENNEIDDFLQVHYMDSDWYDIADGVPVFS